MSETKKENFALGIFFITLFLTGFLIFNVIDNQIVIQVNETKQAVITQPFSLVHVLAIIFLTIFGTISFYIYFNKLLENKKYTSKQKIILNCLETEEKKVYELILLKKEVSQQEIIKDLNLSKVKTSRIIEKLAQKGLVKKYRQGYSNKIKIN